MTLLTDGDEIIAKVQAPRVEEAPVVAAAEEGEGEAAEGEGRPRPARATGAALRRGWPRSGRPTVGAHARPATARPT